MPSTASDSKKIHVASGVKRMVPFLLIGVCALLIVCSETALNSASDALALWWNRVLPALFPFYVLTTLLNRCGTLKWLCNFFRSPLIPCLLFGAFGGYPTGARICRMLNCEPYAVCCNLCSPIFLMGVVAVGMCGNVACFYPLATAHYGSAALLLLIVRKSKRPSETKAASISFEVPAGTMMDDIAAGMQAMLGIGGCILFFYVPVNTLLTALLRGQCSLFTTLIIGVTELTSGCRLVAELPLPIAVQLGIMSFFITFGGICVYAQAMMTAGLARPTEYLIGKAMQGCMAAAIAYLVTPLFIDVSVPALANTAQTYAQNALIGATFLTSACIGLVACYLAALVWKHAKRKATYGNAA